MKTLNLKNKLSLKKETITKLNNDQLNKVFGGSASNTLTCSTQALPTCKPSVNDCNCSTTCG